MKLMVIDGNSIINRAFYGIKLLTTRDGQPTNAVYGFVNILLKLTGNLLRHLSHNTAGGIQHLAFLQMLQLQHGF